MKSIVKWGIWPLLRVKPGENQSESENDVFFQIISLESMIQLTAISLPRSLAGVVKYQDERTE
jgi:hypothetical protein